MVTLFQGGGATAPAQFGTGDWSIAALGNGTTARITITTLPSNGGSAITDLEYQIDGGSWVSLAGTTTGNYDLTGLTFAVEIDVAIRAVNAVGNGTASATKAVTPFVSFAALIAMSPELALDPAEAGSVFQERTGASATTPAAVGDPVGSIRNWGTLGGWLTAPTDAARPILRSASGRLYLEFDGVDDILLADLAALRGVAGWTLSTKSRANRGTGNETLLFVATTAVTSTRGALFAITGASSLVGRRANADGAVTLSGSSHTGNDVVVTGIGDYTNTDAFIRGDGTQEAQNLSWLTSGVTPSDGGRVCLGAVLPVEGAAVNLLSGRSYCAFEFPVVLSGANLTMLERYEAQ